ncbi:sporulation histidine kinase inhibitor Sda [Sutcliffiella horikoshii]|uniref:Sporulation histidine kinase inhibitor Sda n=1 Tax=Sutcliffiella horikoshii TaxID=79883 RepID=A0A5D4TB19_9BACI|nr:sporulation histidine kinase inhibitor Sda [Sutcliffiella horikoshii]TYS72111.1 sporulation histidine kinase inhibitor Sda [Sutcliffiella horikoshii]
MDLLSDESLMEVYEAAIINDLNEEFLKLILDEMKRRKIDIPVSNL